MRAKIAIIIFMFAQLVVAQNMPDHVDRKMAGAAIHEVFFELFHTDIKRLAKSDYPFQREAAMIIQNEFRPYIQGQVGSSIRQFMSILQQTGGDDLLERLRYSARKLMIQKTEELLDLSSKSTPGDVKVASAVMELKEFFKSDQVTRSSLSSQKGHQRLREVFFSKANENNRLFEKVSPALTSQAAQIPYSALVKYQDTPYKSSGRFQMFYLALQDLKSTKSQPERKKLLNWMLENLGDESFLRILAYELAPGENNGNTELYEKVKNKLASFDSKIDEAKRHYRNLNALLAKKNDYQNGAIFSSSRSRSTQEFLEQLTKSDANIQLRKIIETGDLQAFELQYGAQLDQQILQSQLKDLGVTLEKYIQKRNRSRGSFTADPPSSLKSDEYFYLFTHPDAQKFLTKEQSAIGNELFVKELRSKLNSCLPKDCKQIHVKARAIVTTPTELREKYSKAMAQLYDEYLNHPSTTKAWRSDPDLVALTNQFLFKSSNPSSFSALESCIKLMNVSPGSRKYNLCKGVLEHYLEESHRSGKNLNNLRPPLGSLLESLASNFDPRSGADSSLMRTLLRLDSEGIKLSDNSQNLIELTNKVFKNSSSSLELKDIFVRLNENHLKRLYDKDRKVDLAGFKLNEVTQLKKNIDSFKLELLSEDPLRFYTIAPDESILFVSERFDELAQASTIEELEHLYGEQVKTFEQSRKEQLRVIEDSQNLNHYELYNTKLADSDYSGGKVYKGQGQLEEYKKLDGSVLARLLNQCLGQRN